MVRIKDVGYARLGKMLDKSKNTGVETPYLRNVNVRWFGFDLADIQDIRVSEQERVELSLRKGDVLVCEGGEPGRCAIWDRDDSRFVYQKALHRVRLGERCLPQWFCYLLKDAADSGTLNRLFTGTTIKHLTGSSLSVWQFPLPSLNEQIEIVRRVETLFAMAGQVEYRHKVAVNGANGITPALFGNSFAGRLFSMK
jgi:type I restriction enzyme S subunit